MEIGGNVEKSATDYQLFTFPTTTMPDELVSFLPIKDCLSSLSSEATAEQTELCLSTASTLTSSSPTPSPISSVTLVKKVRIEATTTEILNIKEVRVFSDGVDVALTGSASQSSTFKNNANKFGASNAIDNDGSDFSHTDGAGGSWWQVDLSNAVDVQSIEIDNRGCPSHPECLCRMSDANLSLYDGDGNIIDSRSVGDTCGRDVSKLVQSASPITSRFN